MLFFKQLHHDVAYHEIQYVWHDCSYLEEICGSIDADRYI